MISSSAEATRPVLLPQNRRLRHLKGVYLRNLTFNRPRGQTIDDSAIGQTPRLSEARLNHAASSESLRKLRRCSTIANNISSTSQARQHNIEQSIENKVADAFISIHVRSEQEPVYLTETIEHSRNFNFQFFDLSTMDPSISRSDRMVIKLWTKRQQWCLLLELCLNLGDLNFIGPIHNQHFPQNCLVFHLVDGIYSVDLPNKEFPPRDVPPLFTSSYNALMRLSTLENSIQDALATRAALEDKINNLISYTAIDELPRQERYLEETKRVVVQQRRSLKSAQEKRNRLRASITTRRKSIQDGKASQELADKDVNTAMSKLPNSYAALNHTKSLIHGQRRRLCEDLSTIFPIIPVPNGPPLSFQILGIPLPNTAYDPSSASAEEERISAALGYVAYIVFALQFYLGAIVPYEIKPFGSRSSIKDDISLLQDPQREYPLYLRGGASAQARLDYGWYLLNKNVEALCGALNLRVVDIRHTLPNIKYLLFVGSAGKDELPQRKRGGVRGLLQGRIRQRLEESECGGSSVKGSSAGMGAAESRRGSAESEFLARQREEIQKAIRQSSLSNTSKSGGGNETKASRRESTFSNETVVGREPYITESFKEDERDGKMSMKGKDSENSNLKIQPSPIGEQKIKLFDETQTVSLRTKGMREISQST